jgi:hypothetical protein
MYKNVWPRAPLALLLSLASSAQGAALSSEQGLKAFDASHFRALASVEHDAADELAVDLFGLGLRLNSSESDAHVILDSLVCALSVSDDRCRLIGEAIGDIEISRAATGNLKHLFKVLTDRGTWSKFGNRDPNQTAALRIDCRAYNLHPARDFSCEIEVDAGYAVSSFVLDGSAVPAVDALIDRIPASLKTVSPSGDYAVWSIDAVKYDYESDGRSSHWSKLYLSSNELSVEVSDPDSFQSELQEVYRTHSPLSRINHRAGRTSFNCLRPLKSPGPGVCTFFETAEQ